MPRAIAEAQVWEVPGPFSPTNDAPEGSRLLPNLEGSPWLGALESARLPPATPVLLWS